MHEILEPMPTPPPLWDTHAPKPCGLPAHPKLPGHEREGLQFCAKIPVQCSGRAGSCFQWLSSEDGGRSWCSRPSWSAVCPRRWTVGVLRCPALRSLWNPGIAVCRILWLLLLLPLGSALSIDQQPKSQSQQEQDGYHGAQDVEQQQLLPVRATVTVFGCEIITGRLSLARRGQGSHWGPDTKGPTGDQHLGWSKGGADMSGERRSPGCGHHPCGFGGALRVPSGTRCCGRRHMLPFSISCVLYLGGSG